MVRKRKNSEEKEKEATVTVPRLTRRRRVADDDGDLESTILEMSTKAPEIRKTPSTAKRNVRRKPLAADEDPAISTRSQRFQRVKSSSDSETENKVEHEKQKSKGTDINGSYTTRLRSKKDKNSTLQDSTITTVKENVEKSSSPLQELKRQTKRKRVLTAADNTLTENQSPSKSLGKSTRSQAKNLSAVEVNLGSDSPMERRTAFKKSFETPKKVSIPSTRKQHDSIFKIDADTVTPESSPMLINLTPHRSTKTPKKSPMNIGSPKTHSQSPLRLSKTPRKLTINVESPATSDNSLSNHSPTQNKLVSAKQSEPRVILTNCQISVTTITGSVTASESPPIVVTNSRLKRPKSGESKLASQTTAQSSSLTVDEIWAEVSATSPKKKSPAKKIGILASKLRKSPIKTPTRTPKRTPTNARLSNLTTPESPKRIKSTVKKGSLITSPGTPLRPFSGTSGKKDLENKIEALPPVVTPRKINLLLDLANSSPGTTPRGRIRRSLRLTPDFAKFSTGSTSSPFPAGKNTSPKEIPPPLSFSNFGEFKQIENESIELIDGNNFMNVSDDVIKKADGTYELSKDVETEEEKKTEETLEKTEVDNATYELDEPKTPSLRRQSRKRSISNLEPSKCTPEAKKRCRVRFASPAGNKTPNSTIVNNRKSLPMVKTPAKQRTATRLSRGNMEVSSARRRSRSLTKIDEKIPAIKRRSNSASDLRNKTPKLNQSIQNSVNRLSKPRQLVSSSETKSAKIVVPRKVPNFAQIHQKKFAQMESLVDAKERVAKRHVELNSIPANRSMQAASSSGAIVVPELSKVLKNTKKPAPVPAPAPTDAQNGEFNRYGFKLRKADAVKAITKKTPALTRSGNVQEKNRSILKGVRTNRRFELQMKARNIK